MKNFRRVMSLVLSVLLVFAMVSCASTTTAKTGELAGKTIILHTNDVHGNVEGYSYIPTLRNEFESKGADVIVADAGDYIQGSIYVALSKGASAVELMNAVGYDVATLGNHELDFGYDSLKSVLKEAKFDVVCSSLFEGKKLAFDDYKIVKVGKLKIGFFGLQTPETQTKVNPNYVKNLTFADTLNGEKNIVEVAQKVIDKLNKKADIVICLGHLGIDSESIATGCDSSSIFSQLTGWDFVIDAHSHSVMTKGLNGEEMQSTGTQFENIGVIVIDNETKTIEDHYLVDTKTLQQDPEVLSRAQAIKTEIDEIYGAPFATTEVVLKGEKAQVRTSETNLGDLITDAMAWYVKGSLLDDDHIVAITNGGGIRATLQPGNVSMSDIKTVLPFGNTLSIVYVTGAELLESLEASTFCTPSAIGAFPHVSGIEFTVNSKVAYDQGNAYPESTYFAPKSIKRVEIKSINGKPFDETSLYAVVTNNFCAAGGDTYYAFKAAYDAGHKLDLSPTLDEVVVDYVKEVLNGQITAAQYGTEKGRITVL